MTRYTTHGRRWTEQRELARSMRKTPTSAEDMLWDRLRGKRLAGLKFRRQHPVGRFIVDFYCAERGLAIEIDGSAHDDRIAEDGARQTYLEERDIRFLRFKNETIIDNIDEALRGIAGAMSDPAPPLHDVERGLGGEVLDPPRTPHSEAPSS